MGRPEKILDPMQKTEVETLAAVLTAAQIADYFGIGRTTFFAMMARDPEIAERYKRGKAKAIGTIAQGLINKARSGDTASMIFYLKTQGGWRETAPPEQLGPNEDLDDESSVNERLKALIDRMAAQQATDDNFLMRPFAGGGIEMSAEAVPARDAADQS